MVAPPEVEKPQEYVDVTKILEAAGLSVPQIYAADTEAGYLLLEDFGDRLYRRCLEEGASEHDLYQKAIDTLIHLQKQSLDPVTLHPYSKEKFLEEAMVFLEWAFPHITQSTVTAEVETSFVKVWSEAYANLPVVPKGIVLRDFMVDNLMWLPDRSGVQSCGLLDFQDALWGDVTYDVVSLLEDARRDVAPQLVEEMIERYLGETPDLTPEAFYHSYCTWGAQRSTKIVGVFTRLAQRDQKKHYLQHLPRVWKILHKDFKHPALEGVRAWFDEYAAWGDQ